MKKPFPQAPQKGRAALSNREGRFARTERVADPDASDDEALAESIATVVRVDHARSVISRNQSPDIPFEQSINPYRGCEHGCIYCYARPSHAYLDLSPGLDFETQIFYKKDADKRLREELARPGYRCSPIMLGANTDPYQPQERERRVTRALLETLWQHRHPLAIVTKGNLILRDIELLAALGRHNLVSVAISITTLDDTLKRRMEPRAASPAARLSVMRKLSDAGVPVTLLLAPIIPLVNDSEIESILAAAREAGAQRAAYVFIRLPHEVKGLFSDWLACHYPDAADHIMNLIRESHGGREYDARFGQRMTGSGAYAELVRQRFRLASRRLGFDSAEMAPLDSGQFRPPAGPGGDQYDLFSGES